MNSKTTWWRTHPVGHRLLGVLACQLVSAVLLGAVPVALLQFVLTLWLVHRVRQSSGIAWIVLLVLSCLSVGVAVVALLTNAVVAWVLLVTAVLGLVQVVLLLTPPVRGWVGRSGLMSLPGEH